MKIIREVGSKSCKFELTEQELYSAYKEQEHIFDRENIEDVFDQMEDNELVEAYGLHRSELEALIEEMAYLLRKYINKYEMNWSYARDEAIKDVINKAKASSNS